MKQRRFTAIPALVALVALLSAGATVANADVPDDDEAPIHPIEQGSNTSASSEAFEVEVEDAEGQVICLALGRWDNVHISKTLPRAVQQHASWINETCNATHAVITNNIQKRNVIGIYVDVGRQGRATLPSNAWGSGNWAVARYECSSTATHWFRGWVDVDVVGVADDPFKDYSNKLQLSCN